MTPEQEPALSMEAQRLAKETERLLYALWQDWLEEMSERSERKAQKGRDDEKVHRDLD